MHSLKGSTTIDIWKGHTFSFTFHSFLGCNYWWQLSWCRQHYSTETDWIKHASMDLIQSHCGRMWLPVPDGCGDTSSNAHLCTCCIGGGGSCPPVMLVASSAYLWMSIGGSRAPLCFQNILSESSCHGPLPPSAQGLPATLCCQMLAGYVKNRYSNVVLGSYNTLQYKCKWQIYIQHWVDRKWHPRVWCKMAKTLGTLQVVVANRSAPSPFQMAR